MLFSVGLSLCLLAWAVTTNEMDGDGLWGWIGCDVSLVVLLHSFSPRVCWNLPVGLSAQLPHQIAPHACHILPKQQPDCQAPDSGRKNARCQCDLPHPTSRKEEIERGRGGQPGAAVIDDCINGLMESAGVAGHPCCLAECSVPLCREATGMARQAPHRTPSALAHPQTLLPSLRLLAVLLSQHSD